MMSNEAKIAVLTGRQKLLAARDPMINAHIIAKLARRIRKLTKEN